MPGKAPVTVAVLDLRALIGFCRSAALWIEIQAGTRLEWQEYRESTALNVLYALMPWKGAPGTAEVAQDWTRIQTRADQRALQIFCTFFDKLELSGPSAAGAYMFNMDVLRHSARHSVQELFNEAGRINAGVAGLAGQGARNLALIQFSATVLLAATGCWVALGGAVPAVMMGSMTSAQLAGAVGAINLGYNITGSLVKSASGWDKAMAIGIEVGKEGFARKATPWLQSQQTEQARQIATQSGIIAAAEARIEALTEKLSGKLGSKRRLRYNRGVERAGAAIAAAKESMKHAPLLERAAAYSIKAIPLAYLAHDLYNAGNDLYDVWSATE
jgi:hypothetical protein